MRWADMTPKQVAAAHFEIVRDGERNVRELKARSKKEPLNSNLAVIIGFFVRANQVARCDLADARRVARKSHGPAVYRRNSD